MTGIPWWYRRIRLSAPGFLDELVRHPTIELRAQRLSPAGDVIAWLWPRR